ncbi:MAG: hypothetical protein AAF666_19690 [Pseudomonadota bacterium]
METIEQTPDITVAELRDRVIEERGESFALSTIHGFFRCHGVSYKKRPPPQANKSVRM